MVNLRLICFNNLIGVFSGYLLSWQTNIYIYWVYILDHEFDDEGGEKRLTYFFISELRKIWT